MHAAHSLTVSPSMLCSKGGTCLVPGGACLVWGVPAWSLGVHVPRGCLTGPGWGVVSQHALRLNPQWTEFLTHASENITLPETSFAGGNNSMPSWNWCVSFCDASMSSQSRCHYDVIKINRSSWLYDFLACMVVFQTLWGENTVESRMQILCSLLSFLRKKSFMFFRWQQRCFVRNR